jgi:hypothetical protein
MKRAFDQAFEPNSVYDEMLAAFTRRCNQEELNAFESIAQSHLYTTMDGLEMAALRPDLATQARTYAAGHPHPSAARRALIQRIDKATGTSEMEMQVNASVERAMRDYGSTDGDMTAARQFAEETTLASKLYIYRTVKDEDLARYATMLEMPSVQGFTRAYTGAFSEVVQNRVPLAVRQMMQPIKGDTTSRPLNGRISGTDAFSNHNRRMGR